MRKFHLMWGQAVVKYRWQIIGAAILLLALSPLALSRLNYDNSNQSYFLENDPTLNAFAKLQDNFGDTEYLLIGVEARDTDQDLFNAETIKVISELTEFLEQHIHVTQVRSLSKYQYTHDDDGLLATDDLFEYIDDIDSDPSILINARSIMAGEVLALGRLITSDFQHTRISARVENIPGENIQNVKLVSDVIAFIEKQGYLDKGFDLKLSGVPVFNERFETLTLKDQSILMPGMAIMMMIVLFAIFRSFFTMLIPVILILTTTAFVLSLQSILKFPITTVSSALPLTMIILSMGASIHVLVEFFQARNEGLSPKQAASKSVSDLFSAILFTSLTTSIGFLSLSITELQPVRHFALLSAIGPMIIFLISTTILPSILSFIPWIPKGKIQDPNKPKKLSIWLTEGIPKFTYKNRKLIGGLGIAISIVSLYGTQFIRVDANILNYFKSSNWINTDLHYFDDHFKGMSNLEIIVDSGIEGGIKNPVFLARIEALQNYIEPLEETGKPNSLINLLKQINQSLNENNPDYFRLPETRQLAAQFLLLYENTGPDEDLTDIKDFDESMLRISIPIVNMNESKQSVFLQKIKRHISKEFPDLNIEFTGSIVMSNAQNRYVNSGIFKSFGIAILVISICMLFLFASIKHGLIALIPSTMPILLTGTIVSLAGISLDLGSMIVGAMAMGIAVDDSIHVMSRYQLLRRQGFSSYKAISSAMSTSGRAVLLTSLILILGFGIMTFSSFIPYIYVGLFSAMIILFALIADLYFMPALLHSIDNSNSETNEVDEGEGVPQNA